MSRRLELHEGAKAEVGEAARWYESERRGLGLEFMAALDHAFEDLLFMPEMWPLWREGLPWRRARVKRFPYVVFYRVMDGTVRVVAVAHTRRKPGYWAGRVH